MGQTRSSLPVLLGTLLILAVLAQVTVALGVAVPLLLRTVAILLWTGLLPGYLLVRFVLGPIQRKLATPSSTGATSGEGAEPVVAYLERGVYAVGAGLGIMTVVMLLLSYLPDGIAAWQIYAAFDLVLVALVTALWFSAREPVLASSNPLSTSWSTPARVDAWPAMGLVLLLAMAAGLRLVNLGYAEFHGDEARAVLRAAAVIQGYEDVLMLHKKGPLEILAPATVFGLAGQVDEIAARLPFALANLAALLAVFLLGARLFGWMTGWVAAMLLAVDGYLIGFARIVQYQSVVILTSVLVLLILYRLVDTERPGAGSMRRPLVLAAFLWATGLLAHYEAALIVLPALFLLVILARRTEAPLVGELQFEDKPSGKVLAVSHTENNEHATRDSFLTEMAPAVMVGSAVLALFYVPFILHPQFSATYTYLMERRIGGEEIPYNNLADFFSRTTVYSTTYYVLLLIVLTVIALAHIYRRSLGQRMGAVLIMLLCAGLAGMAWQPAWLTLGSVDMTWLFFGVMLGLAWVLPRTPLHERMLWLWFGLPFLLLLFLTAKPRTHVYVFFTPWVLIASATLVQGWQALGRRMGGRSAQAVGVATAAGLLFVFGLYAYWYFVHTRVEILRTWEQNRPAGYWTAYDVPDNRALFGFPLANGWKVIGQLYADGVIAGDYATNEVEFWTPAWYTRGELRCEDEADWFFRISNPQMDPAGYDRTIDQYLAKDYRLWGQVMIFDQPRMGIYRRSQTPFDVQTFRLDAYEPAFDAAARPNLALGYPVVEPPMQHKAHANFDNLLWLEGYDIAYDAPLEPGEIFWLTLYWRGQRPIADSYKVFNQAYYGDGVMVAQRDGYPVCGSRGTWLWDPGELVADVHRIEVEADAPPGLYPLYTGMYIEETFERLPVLGPDGEPVGDHVHLGDIRIGEE